MRVIVLEIPIGEQRKLLASVVLAVEEVGRVAGRRCVFFDVEDCDFGDGNPGLLQGTDLDSVERY